MTDLAHRVQSLSDEVEDLRRRLQQQIRLGKVQSVEANRVVIRHGELVTPPIKWYAGAAGDVKHFRQPTVGETALILNFGGGDTGKQTVALVGFESNDHPLPAKDSTKIITDFGQQCQIIWDPDNGQLTFNVPNKIVFKTETVEVEQDLVVGNNINAGNDVSDKTRSMAADRVIYNGHTHGGVMGGPAKSSPTEDSQ